jgi:hypothetical protein
LPKARYCWSRISLLCRLISVNNKQYCWNVKLTQKLSNIGRSSDGWPKIYYLCASEHTLNCWSRLYLQSLAPTNPLRVRVVGYGPFSLWVIKGGISAVGTLIGCWWRWWWWQLQSNIIIGEVINLVIEPNIMHRFKHPLLTFPYIVIVLLIIWAQLVEIKDEAVD